MVEQLEGRDRRKDGGPSLASFHLAEQRGSQCCGHGLALETFAGRIYFSSFAWKLLKDSKKEKVSLSTTLPSELSFLCHDGYSSGPAGRAARGWKQSSAGATRASNRK